VLSRWQCDHQQTPFLLRATIEIPMLLLPGDKGKFPSTQLQMLVLNLELKRSLLSSLRTSLKVCVKPCSVIFETAQPVQLAPLIMQAYCLTKREGEVTQLILRGWSTAEISATLHISSNTVQDHLKAIFEKVNVRSRRELAGRIFAQQYQPHFTTGAPLDVFGRLTSLDHPSSESSTALS
jgi:DNA-binding CsgD family transcriptional regulator